MCANCSGTATTYLFHFTYAIVFSYHITSAVNTAWMNKLSAVLLSSVIGYVTFLLWILEVPGLILGLQAGWTGRGLCGFSQSHPKMLRWLLKIRHDHFLPHYSQLIINSQFCIQCSLMSEVEKTSLNKRMNLSSDLGPLSETYFFFSF